jgi:hypothetical protein
LTGGQCVLSRTGVSFVYRGVEVYCPWALFNKQGRWYSPGELSLPRDNDAFLPVDRLALPWVEARRDGRAFSQGPEVRTRQVRFLSADEVALKGLYEVSLKDLADLLQHLGRALGKDLPQGPVPAVTFAEDALKEMRAVAVDERGWLTVPLTRLPLPPYCCSCLAPTEGHKEVRASSFTLHLGVVRIEAMEHVTVDVPHCQDCRDANRWAALKCSFWGLLVGLDLQAVSFVPLAVLVWFDEVWLGRLLLVLSALPVLGFSVGLLTGFSSAWFVRLDRYRRKQGIVEMRFRNPHYAGLVMMSSGAPLR